MKLNNQITNRQIDMFPNISLEALVSDEIYGFTSRESVYLRLLQYYEDLFDYPKEQARWASGSLKYKNDNFWWVMNEAWKAFSKPNANLPLQWLSHARQALHWNHMPSNFHPWALTILSRFDLPRYQAAYQMPLDEYEAVARDLPLVLAGLREYPLDRLAPPIDETNWGYSDQ
jgi:hypothetical protein